MLKSFRTSLIYSVLVVTAAITLIPFLYLLCSSLKTQEVFFSSPFLPTNSYLAIHPEPAIAELDTADPDADDTNQADDVEPDPADDTLVIPTRAFEPGTARQTQSSFGTVTVLTDQNDIVAAYQTDDVTITAYRPEQAEADDATGRTWLVTDAGLLHDDTLLPRLRSEVTYGDVFDVAWHELTLDNYRRLFREDPDQQQKAMPFARFLLNSVFFASTTSVLATLFAAMGGYALAKFQFRGREFFTSLVLGALVIPGMLLLAPGYQLLYWLGLLDTYTGLIVPLLAPAFGVYLFRQATVNSVPTELLESGRIDGAGEFYMFFSIVMPLIRPMMGALLLFTFLGTWNNFILPQIVLQTPEKFPLAVGIVQLRGVYSIDYGLIMAATVISIAPIMVLFLMLQREFISGLTSGAVKG